MLALRFLATLFFLVAAVALVADLTPAIYGVGAISLKSFSTHLGELLPRSLETAQDAITNATTPAVWVYVVAPIIAVPTAFLFAAIGLLLGYLGRRRRRVNVYAN